MADDLQASPGRRRPTWGRIWASSIRTRVLAIVLIPSAALLITGVTVASYLVPEGLAARDYSGYLQQTAGPVIQAEAAEEQERTISLRALGGDHQALAGLQAQWNATDAALASAARIANVAQGINAAAIAHTNATVRELVAQLPVVRQGVLTRRASVAEVDGFYTQLTNAGTSTILQSALSAPDSAAAVDEITVQDLLLALDWHSRAVGLGGGWVARGVLSQPDQLVVAQLAGAYRNQLQALAPRLTGAEKVAYDRLVAGGAWRLATSGEDDLARQGRLAEPVAGWLAAEDTVSAGLLGLWGDSIRQAVSAAAAAANYTLSRSVLLGSLALGLALAAFVIALVLANRLVARLRRLRAKTLELADETLPSMVARIADGELVDPEAEMAMSGYGSDEIGQVAEAFNTAQRTAVAAAAAEARTRSGISKVFLDIAHRSQLVVHRQLEVLDVAESKQSDPEHLELLFQLDHLATRARRNAENLLILGGGQPGRRWRRPAGLEDIVRSAVSETEHFARVSTVRLPGVQVQGAVVGDLIHLLAELVDNATAFSPPDAAVTVRGNLVGKGVVVEVEDQGLGIKFDERERLNQTLADPPDFQAMALSGQRHLGLFVVGQLAQRHGISVSLLESAYGGIKAIVLIPSGAVDADGTVGGDSSAPRRPGRHEQPERAPDGVAPDPVPRPRGTEDAGQRARRQAAKPPAEPIAPSPSWPAPHASAASSAPWEEAPGPEPGPLRRGRAPLPRRSRMANLAPGLRPEAEAADSARPRRSRSPEEARGSMSAFQRGTRLGRDSPGQDNR
jgi:signal transduction histidine kinase